MEPAELRPEDIEVEVPQVLLDIADRNPGQSRLNWCFNEEALRAQREACDRIMEKYPQLTDASIRVRLLEYHIGSAPIPQTPESYVRLLIVGGLLIHRPRREKQD